MKKLQLLCFLGYRFHPVLLVMLFCCLLFFSLTSAATTNSQSVLTLSLVNSYSGSLVLESGGSGLLFSDNQRWTSSTSVPVVACASTGSSYTISGTLAQPTIGSGSGSYCSNDVVSLLPGDGLKDFDAEFMRDFEPYQTDQISVFLDTTAPEIPLLEGPLSDELVLGSGIAWSWSGVYDTGVGFLETIVLISSDPSLAGAVAFSNTGSGITIPSADLPGGTLYWSVVVRDKLGNERMYPISFFHNQFVTPVVTGPSDPGGGGGGGGGGGWGQYPIEKDVCAFGDRSGSLYDGTCAGDDDVLPEEGDETLILSDILKELSDEDRYRLILMLYDRFEQPESYPDPFAPIDFPFVPLPLDELENTPFEGYSSADSLLAAIDAGFRDQVIDSMTEGSSGDGESDLCYVIEGTTDLVCSTLFHGAPEGTCVDCVEDFWSGLFLLYSVIFLVGRDVELYYFRRHWELGHTKEKKNKKGSS